MELKPSHLDEVLKCYHELGLSLVLLLAVLKVQHSPADHCPLNLILNRTVLRDLTPPVAFCILTLLLSLVMVGNLRQILCIAMTLADKLKHYKPNFLQQSTVNKAISYLLNF